MAEEKKQGQHSQAPSQTAPPATEGKPSSKIKQIDTTIMGLLPYLKEAAADVSKAEGETYAFHSGSAIKLAAIRIAADVAGLEGAERQAFGKIMAALPTWLLGGNNSACRQAFEKKDIDKGPQGYQF